MGDNRFIVNEDILENAIKILENRSFIDKQDSRYTLINGICQIDHFKTLMRDPSLQKYLYSYLEEFAQQVTYKPIPKGRILFHDGDYVNNIYFVMRGSFIEFKVKSEEDLIQEVYWSQQAGSYKQQLIEAQKSQFELQEKKKIQFLEMSRLMVLQQKHINRQDHQREESITQMELELPQKQQKNLNQSSSNLKPKSQVNIKNENSENKQNRRKKSPTQKPKKSESLEENFFTDDFRQKQSKLKSMNELYLETSKFYQGVEYESLLKIENKYQERYFRDNKCLYKKTRIYSAGMSFGELHDQNISEKDQHNNKKNAIESTIVCNQNSFLLQISCKAYLKIFSKLTEKINFVFNVLANSFPGVKKVILNEFSFQFDEQPLEFNQVLFHQGEACNYVYIMKAGEIDYRKQMNVNGEFNEKRIGMINQGEIFGHEDLFSLSRAYSVHSCVNNSVVYRIKKEFLMISQFNASLKVAVKQKAEYLAKRFDLIQNEKDSNSFKNGSYANKELNSINNLDKTGHSTLLASFKEEQKGQLAKNNIFNSSLQKVSSSGQFPKNSNTISSQIQSRAIQSSNNTHNSVDGQIHIVPHNYFSQAKNVNLGEMDYNLAFKSQSKLEKLQSNSTLNKNDNQNGVSLTNIKEQQKQKNKIVAAVYFTTRAQPESIYSRIVRPDSAFKEEIEQMKKEQAANLQQFSSNDMNSQQNFQDLTSSLKYQSLNKSHRGGSLPQKNEFKLNKMSKNMFALQMQMNSDQKLQKKFMVQQAKDEEQSKENEINQDLNRESQKGILNFTQEQTSQGQISRGTKSMMKYKEQTKDFFAKDKKPKQLDFFMEFQNYRQTIQAKQIYDKLNKNEIKEDPFTHIDFNVVSNSSQVQKLNNGLTPTSALTPMSALTPNSAFTPYSTQTSQIHFYNIPFSKQNSQLGSNSNRGFQNITKTNSILKENGGLKNVSQNTYKTNNSAYYISKGKNTLYNNNYIMNEDEEISNDQANQLNQKQKLDVQKQTSLISDQYELNSKYLIDSVQRSQSREIPNRSSNYNQNQKKLRFSNLNNINQFEVNSKISTFSTTDRRKSNEDNAPLQVRDLTQKNEEPQNLNLSDRNIQNLYCQNFQAESDIRGHYQNSLSFKNLRKASGLRLGAQLHLTSNRDIKLKQ